MSRNAKWHLLATLLVLTGGVCADGLRAGIKVNAALDDMGRAFTFTAPGFTFTGGFSATVVSNGQTLEWVSSEGVLVGPVTAVSEETPYGKAAVKEVRLCFSNAQHELLFRLGKLKGLPGVMLQAGLRNVGSEPLRLLRLKPAVLEGQVSGVPEEWLLTRLATSVIKAPPPVYALGQRRTPIWVHETGMLYCKEGKGFLFGPVGVPTAYMTAHLTHKGEGRVVFDYAANMSGVQVAPGETRWGQQAVLLAEPPNTAYVHWADWVARTHKARTDKGALSGWNSYLFHADKITGQDVLDAVEMVLDQPERLRPMVMSIDVGYEREDGQLGSNDKFPKGLAYYAQRIATTGARPGLRVNFTGPPGFDTILKKARYAVTNGFTYLKINSTGFTNEPQALLTKTSFELMREGFMRLREAVGEETYLLYNDNRPERATVGFVDANRTGATAIRSRVRISMDDVLRTYPLNNRWFAVDNDSYYMGTDIANVSAINGRWPLVRTWMSMAGLSCGTASTADPWSWESFHPYLRNVEVMTPPAREVTEVLELGTSPEWPRLVGHVRRPWGDRTVALLWNPGTTERTVTLDFREIGLDPAHRYAVWSFWGSRYLGVAKGSWKTSALGPSASQHLCFTDLDRTPDKPMLIGSDLHIYCGAAEIKHVSHRRGVMEIELTDAGAREGNLFIYSRRQPVWKAVEGCTVAEIASAGEYVWRLSLVDRKTGASQRVSLDILLPVTRQIWFWALIMTAVASLLFAAWRYVVGVRLHENHALSLERARIARDMHDVVGSRLSRLSLLGEMAIGECTCSQPARVRVQEMTRGVREAAGELEHIIWAMNPQNDTLSELVNRVCQEAEEFFAETPVQCHFETLPEIPSVVLRPEVRSAVGNAVKEALANVLKHASATVVELAMQVDGDIFQIKIVDNGIGFDPAATSIKTTGGYGLSNMRSRLEAMGGECRIESAPGRGTSVILRWLLGKHV